ncbi:MAG: hypothetical protein LAP87_07085 [Acidobacteriia bacterium]|nr:hypothetical protein [Terriglobia bacterium]
MPRAWLVSQRTHEIGIHMALGANRRQAIGRQMRQAMVAVLTGTAAGLAGAIAGTRVLKTLLVGVSPTDALTLCAIPLFLILVAAAAAWLPARRATLVDPLTAPRRE